MKLVFEYGGENHLGKGSLIEMKQAETDEALFTITYGKQVIPHLKYQHAAIELGRCILHHLACSGQINNEGK